MSQANAYPLQQLVAIKQKRQEEAEKVLKEKRAILEKESAQLKELEKARDEVKTHKEDKLAQLRASLDEGTSSDKILHMQKYLKIVQEKLLIKEQKVSDQNKVVDTAKKNVETARLDVIKKQQEVEKLTLHKKEWTQQMIKEELLKENILNDELGAQVHTIKKAQHPFTQSLKKKKS